jgi:hypothetical protein
VRRSGLSAGWRILRIGGPLLEEIVLKNFAARVKVKKVLASG